MFTDKELNILEFDIFPIVNNFNDLQKVFENLNEDQVELFSKWCQSEDIDISEIAVGTFGKEEDDVLYLRGMPTKGYEEHKGGSRPWSVDITKIITESSIILPKDCRRFLAFTNIKNVDTSKGNTSKVQNMICMFYNCKNLEKLDISNGNVSNVRDMCGMFADCDKLEILNVSSGDVSRVKDMYSMFDGCIMLNEIIGFFDGDLSSLLKYNGMFYQTPFLDDYKNEIIQKLGEY